MRRRLLSTPKRSKTQKKAANMNFAISELGTLTPPDCEKPELATLIPQATQRALTVSKGGKYEIHNTFPVPDILHDGEVMIRNFATGLNPIDWKSVEYNFCLPEFPWITGREMAGMVEKVGSGVKSIRVGDRVWTSRLLLVEK
jgi:hypothetical protein